jgi:hypothetical protein
MRKGEKVPQKASWLRSWVRIPPPCPLFTTRRLRYQIELKVKSVIDVILFYMDTREYDQLDALSSSSSMEISQLSVIIKNLKERLESLERNQTDLMDKINVLEREETG